MGSAAPRTWKTVLISILAELSTGLDFGTVNFMKVAGFCKHSSPLVSDWLI